MPCKYCTWQDKTQFESILLFSANMSVCLSVCMRTRVYWQQKWAIRFDLFKDLTRTHTSTHSGNTNLALYINTFILHVSCAVYIASYRCVCCRRIYIYISSFRQYNKTVAFLMFLSFFAFSSYIFDGVLCSIHRFFSIIQTRTKHIYAISCLPSIYCVSFQKSIDK